ncbi:DUF2470 domain-containing protein [Vulcanimicrobium alpinum]|nr:DUF2470 domain-containing protein [Vulcanimicrobium alpinum]
MAELSDAAFAAMTTHMNDDHPDAVAAYAQHYAQCNPAIGARIVTMDATGLTLSVDMGAQTRDVRIDFARTVTDTDDARAMLISMWQTSAPQPLPERTQGAGVREGRG